MLSTVLSETDLIILFSEYIQHKFAYLQMIPTINGLLHWFLFTVITLLNLKLFFRFLRLLDFCHIKSISFPVVIYGDSVRHLPQCTHPVVHWVTHVSGYCDQRAEKVWRGLNGVGRLSDWLGCQTQSMSSLGTRRMDRWIKELLCCRGCLSVCLNERSSGQMVSFWE